MKFLYQHGRIFKLFNGRMWNYTFYNTAFNKWSQCLGIGNTFWWGDRRQNNWENTIRKLIIDLNTIYFCMKLSLEGGSLHLHPNARIMSASKFAFNRFIQNHFIEVNLEKLGELPDMLLFTIILFT